MDETMRLLRLSFLNQYALHLRTIVMKYEENNDIFSRKETV